MSGPTWSPVDEQTQDLLSLVADDPRVEADYRKFLDACRACAAATGDFVYVNDVRAQLTDHNGNLTIEPRRLSAFWNKATGKGRPMVKTGDWQVCQGSGSGNDGRPQPVRRWVG